MKMKDNRRNEIIMGIAIVILVVMVLKAYSSESNVLDLQKQLTEEFQKSALYYCELSNGAVEYANTCTSILKEMSPEFSHINETSKKDCSHLKRPLP